MSGAVDTQRGSGTSAGYAGPIGMLAGRPDGQTNSEWVANGVTGGGVNMLLGDPIGGRVDARQAKDRANIEKRNVQAQQDSRAHDVSRLRALFGMGDSPEANANSQRLSQYLDQYYRTYLQNNLSQVDRQYGDATRRSRQNLARVGQLGSGLETASRRTSLSDYLRGRQTAVTNASSARSALDSSLAGQRMGLEQQISAGTIANPDFQSYIRDQQATLDRAQAAIPANQIGQAFDVAGEAYRNGAAQSAQGNMGLQSFASNGGGGGRIT